MAIMNFNLMGAEELAKELRRKSETDYKQISNDNLIQMRDRAVRSQDVAKGGTPVGDYTGGGQLRLSARVDLNREIFGYTVEYAPHVEYGHRQEVGRYVPAINRRLVRPFVPGQFFLRANVNIQRPIYREDLIRGLNN